MLRLLALWGLLLHAQALPYESLYFSGRLSTFGSKVSSEYKKLIRSRASPDPSGLNIALAYALYQTELHGLKAADEALRPYMIILQGGQGIDARLRFSYYWIQARWLRSQGYIARSFDAIERGYAFAREPWEVALLRLESADNLLLLGNATAATDTLAQLPLSTQLQEPYGSYLQARADYLRRVALWQSGQWDSLTALAASRAKSQHQALYNAEYAYLQALTHFLRGNAREGQRMLKRSIQYARRTVSGGRDLIVRARALEYLTAYQRSYKIKDQYKLRRLNPLLADLRSPEIPTSYATIQALEHLEALGRIVYRPALSENLISLRFGEAEGLRAVRLYRLASRIARAQYRGTIATAYASQAVHKIPDIAAFPSLESALTWSEAGQAALISYEYRRADTAFSRAYQILVQLGEPETPGALPAWSAVGRYRLNSGRYPEAEAIFLRQRGVYRRLFPDPYRDPDFLRNELALADIALRMAVVVKADTILTRITPALRQTGGITLNDLIALEEALGDLSQLKGQFREAEKHYLEAIRLRQRYQKATGSEESTEGASLLRLAMLYQKTGQISRAREVYQRIRTFYERSKREDAEAASFYTGLTEFYLAAGDYLKAEEGARKALELNQKLFGEASPGYVSAALSAARVEHALGRYDKEKALLTQVLGIQRTLSQDRGTLALGRTLYLLAENAFLSGHKDTAAAYLSQSDAQARSAQGIAPLEYADLALDIGGLWLAMDSLSLAESQFSTALSLLEKQVPAKHPTRLRASLYNARLLRAKGEFSAAIRAYTTWLGQWRSVYGAKHPEYPFHLAELADLQWLARNISAAKSTYTRAITMLLDQVDRLFNGLTESEKTRYWVRVRQVLEHYFAFAFTHGSDRDKQEAYETYLTTKAFLLSETAQLRARLSASRDTTIQRVFKEWQDQKEYVVRLYAYSTEELKTLNVNLAQEEEKLNRLEKLLTQFIGDIRLRRAKWSALRAAIPADGAALDWIRLRMPLSRDSIVYYAVLTLPSAKKPVFILYPKGRSMETVSAFRYAQAILNFELDTVSFATYWAPVAAALPASISKLYVSNDGIFNQINLSTIRTPEGGYLVDKYQVVYHTRLASLTHPPKPFRYWDGRKALLIADPDYAAGLPEDSVYIPPLPGTAEEAKAIYDILRSEGILPYLYVRSEAGEKRLYETTSPYILHVATHGVFLPYAEGIGELLGIQSAEALANPLFRSALLLADAGRSMIVGSQDVRQDGIANAYELLSLNLSNTQLVVLSACETGLGDVQNGEGVYGLQRAFLLAGARNLIVSLWRVEDQATRDFMITFYNEWLRKKLPIEEAFLNTQRTMRRSRTAPYFWGAFLLVRP